MPSAAVHDLENALDLSGVLGNELAEARVLRDLCEAYAGLRRFTDAEEAIRAALELFEGDAVSPGADGDVRQPAEAKAVGTKRRQASRWRSLAIGGARRDRRP